MAIGRRVLKSALAVLLLLAIFAGGWLAGRLGIGSVVNPASLTDVERQFAERMRGGRARRRVRTATTSRASRRSATTCGASTPRWTAAA